MSARSKRAVPLMGVLLAMSSPDAGALCSDVDPVSCRSGPTCDAQPGFWIELRDSPGGNVLHIEDQDGTQQHVSNAFVDATLFDLGGGNWRLDVTNVSAASITEVRFPWMKEECCLAGDTSTEIA